jgi:2-polyprenyl-3-methyl-5-hydroxy-6-metoxy-1,4-benzoquinol methylase
METESLVKVYICRSEKHSWDTIWKWSWFTRKSWEQQYWKEVEKALKPLFQLLQKLSVGSILDCSCGLGFKTIMLAKMGYEVEGSDASKVAIKYAPKFAKEHGLILKFFHSRFEDLSENCNRKYDCIFSDYFDELRTRRALEKSAMGIYSVLKDHGKFIFCSVHPN